MTPKRQRALDAIKQNDIKQRYDFGEGHKFHIRSTGEPITAAVHWLQSNRFVDFVKPKMPFEDVSFTVRNVG